MHHVKLPEVLQIQVVSPQVSMIVMKTQILSIKKMDLEPVRESVRLLMASGIDYEFRTTVVDELHSEEDFDRIGQWIQGAKRYYLQAFTDRDTVPFGGLHAPSAEKMKNCLARVKPWVEAAQLRGVDE